MGQTQTVRQRKTGQTDGQGHIDRDRQTDRQTKIVTQRDRKTDRYRPSRRETGTQPASQTDRQAESESGTHRQGGGRGRETDRSICLSSNHRGSLWRLYRQALTVLLTVARFASKTEAFLRCGPYSSLLLTLLSFLFSAAIYDTFRNHSGSWSRGSKQLGP